MGRKTDAVLEHISDVLIRAEQDCLTSAVSSNEITVGGARNINISNVTLTTTARGTSENCTQTVNVGIGETQTQEKMKKRLENVIKAENSMRGDKVKFVQRITDSFDVRVRNTCSAIAIATTKLHFGKVGGDVTIDNVDIRSTATARIMKCISNVQVRIGNTQKPLQRFIEDEEEWFDIEPLEGGKGGTVEPSGEDSPCASTVDNAKRFMIGCICGGAVLVVIVFCALLIAHTNRQKVAVYQTGYPFVYDPAAQYPQQVAYALPDNTQYPEYSQQPLAVVQGAI